MAKTAPAEVVKEVVTRTVLSIQGLNAQAFSGTTSPSTLYRAMVTNMPSVMPYYREVEEKDTCIASSLEVRRLLVMAREWSVVGADDENGQALEYKDAASAFLNEIPKFATTLEEMLDAPAYGYTVAEIYWKNNGDRISVEKITGRPQEFFDFRESLVDVPLGDLRYLQSMIPPGDVVPPEKFLVSSSKPRHGDRRGLPLLRRLFWPSWFKRQGLRLYLQFLEKGQGTVAVGYSDSAGGDEKAKALAAAQAIAEEIAVAIPNTMKIMEQLLSNTRHHDGNDFYTLLGYMDAEITRMILGQTLSTRGSEQNVGTQALGEVHQDLLFEIVRRDANDLSDVIDGQLLQPWLLWTFGDAALDRAFRPHFRIDTSKEKDVLAEAKLLKEARGLVDVTRAEAYERLGIREPEQGEMLVNEVVQPVELTGFPQ